MQDCLHIERAERQMADGVRVCVSCAAASPVLPLVYVEDWPEVCGGSGHEASSNTHPSSSGNAPTSLDEEGHSDSSLVSVEGIFRCLWARGGWKDQ